MAQEQETDYNVGAYIFNMTTKKILIISSYGTKIGIPKGALNENETYWDGAMREVFEETNLRILITQDTPCVQYTMFGKHRIFYIVTYNMCENELYFQHIKPVDTDEIKMVEWYSYQDLVDNVKICNSTILQNEWNSSEKFVINGLIQAVLNPDFNYYSFVKHNNNHNTNNKLPVSIVDMPNHPKGLVQPCYISYKFVCQSIGWPIYIDKPIVLNLQTSSSSTTTTTTTTVSSSINIAKRTYASFLQEQTSSATATPPPPSILDIAKQTYNSLKLGHWPRGAVYPVEPEGTRNEVCLQHKPSKLARPVKRQTK